MTNVIFFFKSFSSLHFQFPSLVPKPPPFLSFLSLQKKSSSNSLNSVDKTLIGALSGVLSFGLLFHSPLSVALDYSSVEIFSLSADSSPSDSSASCVEDELPDFGNAETVSPPVTNEDIVQEAWEIVNDSFLDAGHHRWSPEAWKQRQEDIMNMSIQTRSKAHNIIRRMLASLGDPYTRFLPPAEFSKMARYDMTGIGINLREVPDDSGGMKIKVLGLLLDGPAHLAGIRQGDEVLAVNGVDARGKSAFEVSSLLQGPNETQVTVKVKHGNCGPEESIQVQRQVLVRSPVFYRLEQIDAASSVGYVRLKEFNALAKKDLVTAMKRLEAMGASYFILDLRDNLGGLVQAGIEIAKLFLNEGSTVIYTVGRDPQYQKTVVADTGPLVTAPVVVLVNKKTASASEIVASSLHDNCRAVLVGERTYGKGLIQSVFELHDRSGVAVTVGKYVTPNHKDINGNGIEPDFQNFPAWTDVTERLSQCIILHQG
ncbi:carboxyl-terminal-processing peptidase 1, chloroplastic isoform X1 [Cucurbita moschata]|uniref:C-terminal processing peptidase n=1 Tax=Cucurbita moschata TaxID=3662 RepID=A0A6J1GT55_CUCMO|nr:carboxyl-terminal-processing peptidase 1, chloroplastic isoform X1 [Cucurbita moschata]XP_022955148.1 carboxyl-terminal-processing peptidase 1, chloroplastic isoform X1 [Cucurbita moschata]